MMSTLLFVSLILNVSCAMCGSADKCQYGTSLLQVSEKVVETLSVGTDSEDLQAPAANATPPTAKQEANATKPASTNGSAPSNSTGGETMPVPANATNATDVVNASENTTTPAPAPTGCATKEDPRVKAWFTETSPVGTPCVFGVDGDVRDEGSHCIFDNGEFGSNGWCYTAKDRSSWGSCNGECPLYGPSKQLGGKIEHMSKQVDKALQALNNTAAPAAPVQPAAAAIPAAPPQPAATVAPAAQAEAPATGAEKGPKEPAQTVMAAVATPAPAAVAAATLAPGSAPGVVSLIQSLLQSLSRSG